LKIKAVIVPQCVGLPKVVKRVKHEKITFATEATEFTETKNTHSPSLCAL